jgi:peptidoglycan/xylan/chitin deacetylase (PgdA/CDA1 family)
VSRPLVLCYHAISDGWPHLLSVPPQDFERQLELLIDRGHRPARAEDVLAGRGRLLHVTFDDAFTSVRAALPTLERLKVPGTVFACSGFADEGGALRIAELAADADARPDDLATMTWDDLRELVERGIEIGAHTVSHPHLPQTSDEELDRELVESKRRVEDELSRPCPHLAYPFGAHDARVRAAAARAGFRAAFGLQPRGSTWRDPFQLPRVGIWRGESDRTVAFKTSPAGRSAPVTALRRARDAFA